MTLQLKASQAIGTTLLHSCGNVYVVDVVGGVAMPMCSVLGFSGCLNSYPISSCMFNGVAIIPGMCKTGFTGRGGCETGWLSGGWTISTCARGHPYPVCVHETVKY